MKTDQTGSGQSSLSSSEIEAASLEVNSSDAECSQVQRRRHCTTVPSRRAWGDSHSAQCGGDEVPTRLAELCRAASQGRKATILGNR